MTQIWLVRHGATAWSVLGKHTSITDLDLTDDGVAQAAALRGRLAPEDFGLVLVSPLLRARRTAQLAGFTDVDIEPDLIEWNYGRYEGLTTAQIRADDPAWTVFAGGAQGGETPEQVRSRLSRVIERAERSGVDRVLCFAHGHSLRVLALTWLGLDIALGEHFPLDTGTVSVLGQAKGVRALLRWNARE